MKLSMGNVFSRITNLLAYIAMIGMNSVTVFGPLQSHYTQSFSETYPSLFTPAGYVFSIWGIIYILLGGCIVFQFLDLFLKRHEKVIHDFVERKSGWFVLSCLLNIGWLVAWYGEYMAMSLLAMAGLFVTLSFMYAGLDNYASGQHPRRFTLFFLIPIRLYFGWISVAIFANASIVIASMGIWQSLGSQIILSIILIAFVVALLVYILLQYKDRIFTAVGFWALIGIFLKRLLTDPLETYPIILATVLGLLVLTYILGRVQSIQHLG